MSIASFTVYLTVVNILIPLKVLSLSTPMSSVTRHQFLSQEHLCRVALDILSIPLFFVKRKLGLHPGNCFEIYYTLENYKIQQYCEENWYLSESASSFTYLNCLIF